jgi:hypothetical protein
MKMNQKNSILEYAKLLATANEVAAKLKALKPEIIDSLKALPEQAVKTEYGVLSYRSKSGAREINEGVMQVLPMDVIKSIAKIQIGALDKAIKAGDVELSKVEKFITVKPNVDEVTLK